VVEKFKVERMRLLKTIWLLIVPMLLTAQHPVTFFTKAEAAEVKNNLTRYPLLAQTYSEIKKQVDESIGKDIDVPFPKDAAGGYTHERHKANYILMFNSGVLYNLTGDVKYATLVKNMLLKYSLLNPTLKNHPQATSSSPGHLFWQALNDANWLVYAAMAYDLAYNSFSADERKKIEQGAFKPEVDFFTKDLNKWFNLIHNHGVWACAAVGITGIATANKDYVDMALYGTEKNGKAGFISQMDSLFSPDGYYTEGPYYVRYAILPYYLFANALNHARPELKIFEHRNRILQKALLAGLEQTNLDGRFFPLNDAIKEKDYTTNEMVTAIDIAWNAYGSDDGLLMVAKKQNSVLLNKGGASIAAALASGKNISPWYHYHSVEYADGAKGDEGGVSLLRNGKDAELTTLIYKYTSHGLSHGHFDKLNLNLFDKGNEILSDYGSVRFVGIEQKYGGRYLPENSGYAAQTIAHNTIVVDESSHFNGSEEESEKYHSDKLFSNITNPAVQVVAAKEDNAYKNVHLQRTLYLLQLQGSEKIIVDIFNIISPDEHRYDLPFQYNGQLIGTSFKYNVFTKNQETMGLKNGYQFLWKEAEADAGGPLAQFTFLNGTTYYSISALTDETTKLFFTRTGANDPNFNLRREASYIIRKKGKEQSFVNVIEVHGKFDPVTEFSTASYPSVQQIKLLQNDEEFSVAEIMISGKKLLIIQVNRDFDSKAKHTTQNISWAGPYMVLYDGKIIN
jgi:predicted regulator of Ras-like GTPase activity (Roadblock/LC7/MglB family)